MVGMLADDKHAGQALRQRQRRVPVREQHDAFFGLPLRNQFVVAEVDQLRVVVNRLCVECTDVDQACQDARHHIVDARLRHLAVAHRITQRLTEVMRIVEIGARLHVQPCQRRLDGRMRGAPVRHDPAGVTPFILEHLLQQEGVFGRIVAIDQVIAGHDGARLADRYRDLERQQVGFAQRRFGQVRADHHAPRFLAVGDEMFDGRDDTLRLDAGNRMAGQLAGEQRILADVFEIATAARFADQVRAPCELHIEALGLRLASDQCAAVVCELAVEGRAQQQRTG